MEALELIRFGSQIICNQQYNALAPLHSSRNSSNEIGAIWVDWKVALRKGQDDHSWTMLREHKRPQFD